MISILLEVRTVYIHEPLGKTTLGSSRRRADLITASGMTNRRVEARASAQQLELATNKPHIRYLIRFLQNPLPPSTVRTVAEGRVLDGRELLYGWQDARATINTFTWHGVMAPVACNRKWIYHRGPCCEIKVRRLKLASM
jgi:hypothetical protein